MRQRIAQIFTKAIVQTNHPLFDFRNQEARDKTKWMFCLRSYLTQNISLLDIGCGTGKQSFAAEELGAKVCGLDCSKRAIAFANNLKQELRSNCEFVRGDYTKMPFKSEKFDVAIFPKNIVECSYKEMEKLCVEVQRVLKDNGKFVITMKDGIEEIAEGKIKATAYHYKKGVCNNKVTLPDGKRYSYPTFFWTVSFARNLVSHYFEPAMERKLSDCFLLVFCKS